MFNFIPKKANSELKLCIVITQKRHIKIGKKFSNPFILKVSKKTKTRNNTKGKNIIKFENKKR